jgi:peroxiredoxin
MQKKWLGFILVAALLAGLALTSLQKSAAPELTFTTLNGSRFTTQALRGKVVLINFWATTCTTCIHEMPQLVKLHQKLNAKGYETVAVAMDYDNPEYVANFAQQQQLPFKMVFDAKGSIAQGFGGVRLTPTSLLLDKNGNIVQKYLGEPDFGKLETLVENLLTSS